MESILRKIAGVPKDKLLHFTAGMLLFLLANIFFTSAYSLLVVFLIGLLKEAYDRFHTLHSVEFKDFLATSLGALVVYVLINLKI